MWNIFKKPYYFPRKDFILFTRYELPPEFDGIKRPVWHLNMVNIDRVIGNGLIEVTIDIYSSFRTNPQPGDVWVSTSQESGSLIALVFISVSEFYREQGYILFNAKLQNFGYAGDLLQLDKMKEHVINGGKMKPVMR